MDAKEIQVLWSIIARVEVMQKTGAWLDVPPEEMKTAVDALSREEQNRLNGDRKTSRGNPPVQRKTKRHPVLPKRK